MVIARTYSSLAMSSIREAVAHGSWKRLFSVWTCKQSSETYRSLLRVSRAWSTMIEERDTKCRKNKNALFHCGRSLQKVWTASEPEKWSIREMDDTNVHPNCRQGELQGRLPSSNSLGVDACVREKDPPQQLWLHRSPPPFNVKRRAFRDDYRVSLTIRYKREVLPLSFHVWPCQPLANPSCHNAPEVTFIV